MSVLNFNTYYNNFNFNFYMFSYFYKSVNYFEDKKKTNEWKVIKYIILKSVKYLKNVIVYKK